MMTFIVGLAGMLFALHMLAGMWPGSLTRKVDDREMLRQHHERCALLALIALAVFTR